MTIDEVHTLKPGESAWLEWRILHEDGTINNGMELAVVTPDYAFHYEGTWDDDIKKVELDDFPDQQSRFWSKKPDKGQRDATPWPEWKKEEWYG